LSDLYDFGKKLEGDVRDGIKVMKSKSITLAGYGAAIVTFLVSSASLWSRFGDKYSPWIAACAGFSGMLCAQHSILARRLSQRAWISQDEWLKEDCLDDFEALRGIEC
jgi:hypothetical protein